MILALNTKLKLATEPGWRTTSGPKQFFREVRRVL